MKAEKHTPTRILVGVLLFGAPVTGSRPCLKPVDQTQK